MQFKQLNPLKRGVVEFYMSAYVKCQRSISASKNRGVLSSKVHCSVLQNVLNFFIKFGNSFVERNREVNFYQNTLVYDVDPVRRTKHEDSMLMR